MELDANHLELITRCHHLINLIYFNLSGCFLKSKTTINDAMVRDATNSIQKCVTDFKY